MPTISVAMIVKNEAADLAQCLDTVKDWVDEIIIVDSGSTDNTQEIAEQYGAKFYSHPDWPGFGKQRQRAQQYVTSDYVLWLDADERITPKLRESIQQAVQQDTPNTVYDIPRVSEVFGRVTGDLEHFTYKSIHHYLVKSAGYAKAWADQRQAKGKKATLWQGISHAIGCFVKMYILKAGFLDGKQGFLLAVLSAHSTFVKYADLWEREQK